MREWNDATIGSWVHTLEYAQGIGDYREAVIAIANEARRDAERKLEEADRRVGLLDRAECRCVFADCVEHGAFYPYEGEEYDYAQRLAALGQRETSACRCAAIQREDPRRHFKGCPERKPLPEEDQAAIDKAHVVARGTAINRLASAGARRVEAEHAQARTAPHRALEFALAVRNRLEAEAEEREARTALAAIEESAARRAP